MQGFSVAEPPEVPRVRAFLESGRMRDDPVAIFRAHQRRLGDDYVYHFGGMRRVRVVSDPAMLRRVLKDNAENYRKSEIQMRRMRRFLGPGLLTHHGEAWRRQRRLIQRGFGPRGLEALGAVMRASLADSLADFETRLGEPVDLGAEMTAATFAMVARSLFGAAMTAAEIALVSEAILRIQAFIVRQITEPHLAAWFVASGELARHDRLRRAGDAVLRRHVDARRRAGEAGDDLLGVLLSARHEDTGEGLSDEEVLCECMQLLVAGHETSSNALAWTLYLLERDPDTLARVRAEFEAVIGDRPLGWSDVARLPEACRALEEALRLYPPFWMVDREAVADDEAGGRRIAAGETIVAFLYGVHRDAGRWPEPDSYRPARIGPSDRKTTRDFTYLPFGGGPRGCVGANYAMMQMLMVLEAWTRRYDWSVAEGGEVAPAPLIILRQRPGATTRVRRRERALEEGAT